MPDLDVSEILTDPDFCETVTVRRITQNISDQGRATQDEVVFEMIAVVTIGAMGAAERAQDYELAKNTITVHSQTPLRSITQDAQADIVVWGGNNYLVKRQYNWSHYGSGFTACECVLQDVVEAS